MFLLSLLLSGALAFGTSATGGKAEVTCNVRKVINDVQGSLQGQLDLLKEKVEHFKPTEENNEKEEWDAVAA